MLRKLFCCLFLLIVGLLMLPVGAGAQTATETTLYTFCATSTCPGANGGYSPLIQASDGNYYGTTTTGGPVSSDYAYGCGTFYRMTPSGSYTTLHDFNCGSDGANPNGGLAQGGDGNFYGTTLFGGANNAGAIFKISPVGVLTTIASFASSPAGAGANGSLVLGTDGNFWGTTRYGGGNCTASVGCGTIFKVSPAGVLNLVYSFCNQTNCTDGNYSTSGLIQASDGIFYGTTSSGGDLTACPEGGCGVLFRINLSGTFASLYNFCSQNNCADGGTPEAGVVEASNGNLYGTTTVGGENGGYSGTIFQYNSNGNTQTYGSICGGCSEGTNPTPGLTVGSDGNMYGVTATGGNTSQTCLVFRGYGCGTFFQLAGFQTINTLYAFCSQTDCADGEEPQNGVLQGSDGSFYGTTVWGGELSQCGYGCGTIYKVALTPALPAPVQVALSGTTVDAGQAVTLTWQVLNAFSLTMQQCYAFVQNNAAGAGGWTGVQTGTMANGVYSGSATITPTAAGVYSYALTCGGTESGFATLQVGSAKSSTTTTVSATSPVILGSVVTLTAMPSATQNIGPITGTVAFSSGGLSLGTVTLTNGAASLNVTAQGIPTGTYRVTASYSGDSNYQPSVGTTSVTVLGYGTATSLSASTGQVTQGQAVTLSSTVTRTAMSGTPSGSVTFSYGSTVLGTAKVVNGTASFTAATNGSIPPGSYGITAKYDGDATDQTSVSSAVHVTVVAATATTLTASPMTVPKDSAVTLTSVVKRKYDAGVPTGSVTFSVGGHNLGTQALDGTGTAVVNASSVGIAAGMYPVTATYSGDAANAASSATVSVKVE